MTYRSLQLAFLMILAESAYAQVQLSYNSSPGSTFAENDLLEVSIVSPFAATDRAFLVISVCDKAEGGCYSLRSSEFELQSGYNRLDPRTVQVVQSSSDCKGIRLTASEVTLKPGDYQICYKLVAAGTGLEWVSNCRDISVEENEYKEKGSGISGKLGSIIPSGMDFHGQIKTSADNGYYYMPYSGSANGSTEFDASFKIGTVPLTGGGFLTSQQGIHGESLNRYHFSFDTDAFKRALREKAAAKLKEQISEQADSLLVYQKYVNRLSQLKTFLDDPTLVTEFARLGAREEVLKRINDIEQLHDAGQLKEIQGKYEQLNNADLKEEALKLQPGLDSMLRIEQQLDSLRRLREQFEGIQRKMEYYERMRNEAKGIEEKLSAMDEAGITEMAGLQHGVLLSDIHTSGVAHTGMKSLLLPQGEYAFYDYELTGNPSGCTTTMPYEVKTCDCLGTFGPIVLSADRTYVASYWIREDVGPEVDDYTNTQLTIKIDGVTVTPISITKSDMVERWQRVEVRFVVPSTAMATDDLELRFDNLGSTDVFVDDVRVHPFDGNMKSYVYDPVLLKLIAELDENNFATFYEYDPSGALIRVKKETERGIMTIQESRQNIYQGSNPFKPAPSTIVDGE